MSVFELRRGTSPVILAFPHTGTDVPPDIARRLNEEGRISKLKSRPSRWTRLAPNGSAACCAAFWPVSRPPPNR